MWSFQGDGHCCTFDYGSAIDKDKTLSLFGLTWLPATTITAFLRRLSLVAFIVLRLYLYVLHYWQRFMLDCFSALLFFIVTVLLHFVCIDVAVELDVSFKSCFPVFRVRCFISAFVLLLLGFFVCLQLVAPASFCHGV